MGWWSPDPRAIIPLEGLQVSRSLRRSLRRYEVRLDTAFEDVVDASLVLLDQQAASGIYHCVNSGMTTWHELGEFVARTIGADPALLVPVRVADVAMRAPRPQYCALSNDKLAAAGVRMPEWQDALARHLGSR